MRYICQNTTMNSSPFVQQYEEASDAVNWTLYYRVATGTEECMPEACTELWAEKKRFESLLASIPAPRTMAPDQAPEMANQALTHPHEMIRLTPEQRKQLHELVYEKCSRTVWCDGLDLLHILKS